MRFALTFLIAGVIGCFVSAGILHVYAQYQTGTGVIDWDTAIILGVIIGVITAVRTRQT